VQFDPKFLELPGIVQLATYKQVPTRPTAEIELKFDEREDAVICIVHESKIDMVNRVLRVRGGDLEICHVKYDQATKQSTDTWYAWNHQYDPGKSSRFSSEEEAMCWMVLLVSDVGCPGQARADFPQTWPSPLWAHLVQEMKNLHTVASVMLT
jgi:hypothetical protein